MPKWAVWTIVAAAVAVVGIVAAILIVVVSGNVAAQQKAEAEEAAASARLQLIPDAVESCNVSLSYVTAGGRRFEASTGLSGDIRPSDVNCILAALGAPEDIVRNGVQLQAGDPPGSVGWGDFTLTEEYPYFMANIRHEIELSE